MIGPDSRIRRVMLAGVLLTLVGVVGLAFTLTGEPGSRPSPWWFVPFYAAGSLLLIGGGFAWLRQMS